MKRNEKIVLLGDGKDTAGQEKFNSVAPLYYRDADAAIIVYDINNRSSFDKVGQWIKQLRNFCVNKHIVIAIAANQSDLLTTDSIQYDEGYKMAQSYQALFLMTSAKTGQGIQEIFQQVVGQVIKSQKSDNQSKIKLIDNEIKKPNDRCC